MSRDQWQVPLFETLLWTGRKSDWCVVIPVINEQVRLRSLMHRMRMLGIAAIADIVVVDGGSTDGTLDCAAELARNGASALLVKTGRGRLSAQLRCAYAFAMDAGYLGVVTIDGNDKDDPAAIPQFIAALQDGVDFVQASRFIPGGIEENTPWGRRVGIRWIHAPVLSAAARFRWTDTTQGFRAYSRRLLLDPRIAAFREVFDTYELLAYMSVRAPRLGFRCQELPSARRYPAGEVPTKITKVGGSLKILRIMARAALHKYDPPAA